jgi:dihydroorotase
VILIKGGRVASSSGATEADILIERGRVKKVAPSLSADGAEVVDAAGLLVLPGAIDPHVHFRDPENTSKEDFSTGSSSALAGGVTTVMDMPNYRNPPTTTAAAYNEKRKIAAAKARCDYVLRFGASETNAQEAAQSGAPQLKMFLSDTKSELCCTRQAALEHFRLFPKDKPICVHAEDRDRIAERAGKFSEQSEVQDKLVSQLACEFALSESEKAGRRVHICHLTTAKEVEMCRQHKRATYEITPSHLFLSTEDLPVLSSLGRINPPLRDKREQAALWKAIGLDTMIGSDHAPHLVSHKLEGAPGFPGVGTLLPLLLDAAHQKRLDLAQVVRMCCENPADAFGLAQKGRIAAGKDADLVLVAFDESWKITADNRLSKCGWTPFEGRQVFGKIRGVYLRGSLAYDGESVISKPGQGKELA